MSYTLPFTISNGTLGVDYTVDVSNSLVVVQFLTPDIDMSLNVLSSITDANVLIVGGGGGSAAPAFLSFRGGGGGGQGILLQNTYNQGSYSVHVGSGGSPTSGSGGATTFNTTTSLGGTTSNISQYGGNAGGYTI